MIKGISEYKETEAVSFANSELPKLEPGGYVLKIIAVKVEDTQWGARLAFQFDICEGENKLFFKRLFDATPNDWDNKKWKGSYRLFLPQNKGDAEKYKKSVGFFKSQLEAFEKSNAGLTVNAGGDWDEQILKGKIVGAVFNEKEWELDGKTGFFTQCKRLIPASDIREGKFTIPKPDKLRASTAVPAVTGFSSYVIAETETSTNSGGVPDDMDIFGNVDGVPF